MVAKKVQSQLIWLENSRNMFFIGPKLSKQIKGFQMTVGDGGILSFVLIWEDVDFFF